MSFVTRRALSTLIPPKTTTTARATRNEYQRDSRIRWFRTRIALDYVRPPERSKLMLEFFQAIGGAPDALRMQRVVSFYEKLPRGAVPEAKAKGLLGRYQAKYFGKKTSVQPIIHVLALLIGIGYAQNYYFHLRHHKNNAH
ncbi:ATP synthase subunit f, mitochondrial [Metarhizium anisopliae]|nr:ATP synthase subunit f, mitochondrial [Metarhizium anisopliae]